MIDKIKKGIVGVLLGATLTYSGHAQQPQEAPSVKCDGEKPSIHYNKNFLDNSLTFEYNWYVDLPEVNDFPEELQPQTDDIYEALASNDESKTLNKIIISRGNHGDGRVVYLNGDEIHSQINPRPTQALSNDLEYMNMNTHLELLELLWWTVMTLN